MERTDPDGALAALPRCWRAPSGETLDHVRSVAPTLADALGSTGKQLPLPWPQQAGRPLSSAELARLDANATRADGDAHADADTHAGANTHANADAETHAGDLPEPVVLGEQVLPVVPLFPSRALRVIRELARLLPATTDLSDDGEVTRGVVLGADLRFWVELVRRLAELTRSGRVVPALRHADDTWFGCWTLLGDATIHSWLGRLATVAPPSALAPAPGQPVRAAIADACDELVDLIARAAIAGVGTGLDPATRRTPLLSWITSLETGEPITGWSDLELTRLESQIDQWRGSAFTPPFELLLRIAEPPALPDAAARRSAADDRTVAEGGADAGDENADAATVFDPTTTEGLPADGADADAYAEFSAIDHASAATEPAPEPDDADQWQLQLRLRSLADPSLVVTAAEAARLPDAPDRPAQVILTELGRAAAVYRPLLDVFDSRQSFDAPLDLTHLLDLVEHGVPALQLAGFAVQLPARWAKPKPTLRLTATPTEPIGDGGSDAPSRLGMRQLMEFHWQVALGDAPDDEPLTEDELRALAEAKEPLVRLRGTWVQLDQDQLARALRFLQDPGPTHGTVADLFERLAGGSGTPLPVTEVEARGWLGDLLAGRHEQLEQVPPPSDLAATLRPYQERGLSWLAFMGRLGLGAILADDMGLGKTVQLLAAVLADRAAGGAGPTLVVCPMSVVGNWQREAARFAPTLRVLVHHGTGRAAGEDLRRAAEAVDLVVTSYGLLSRDGDALAQIDWRTVVLDEAQHIKNHETRTARAARLVGAHAHHRVALSGTPVENRLDELRSILDFANPGLLGSAASFRQRFAQPIEKERDPRAAAQLRQITGPFVLRRLKSDPEIISDLPEKLELTVRANLTAEQASLYQAVVDDMLAQLNKADGIARKGLILATLTRLKQVCNHPAHFLADGSALLSRTGEHRSGKLALIDDIVDTVLADGEKVLCFTQYHAFGSMLQPYFTARYETPIPFLHGGLTKKAREKVVDDFQSEDGPPILLLSLKAGGTGLNLTAASQVVHVDRWWNPAVEDQATDRAYRIGQKRRVQVRKMICVGTLEERIDQMITDKRELADLAVGTGESWLTELSTDELADLVALSADAVAQ